MKKTIIDCSLPPEDENRVQVIDVPAEEEIALLQAVVATLEDGEEKTEIEARILGLQEM